MKATPANKARTTERQRCFACQYNHGDLFAVNEENKSSLSKILCTAWCFPRFCSGLRRS